MEIYGVGAAAFFGAVLVGFIGWLKTTEPFAPRKFGVTVVTAILAGATIAIGYAGDRVVPRDFLLAFLAGAGIDYARNVVSGSIAARVLPSRPPEP